MKRELNEDTAEEEQKLDVSSLIDVCFLLLIYFLVTSTIVPRESDLGMAQASEVPTEVQVKLEPLVISISGGGEIHVGSGDGRLLMDRDLGSRELPMLNEYLGMYVDASRASGSRPLVRIDVDEDSSHQRVVDVLNALSGVGIENVAFRDGVL